MNSRTTILVTAATCLASSPLGAGLIFFDSPHRDQNDAVYARWLQAAKLDATSVQYTVDFETGFVADENIAGRRERELPGRLVLDNPQHDLRVQSGANFGDSLPMGDFALASTRGPYTTFDFSLRPVDYFAIQDIDHLGAAIRVRTTDGVRHFRIDPTEPNGYSAEFFGLVTTGTTRIHQVDINAAGDSAWGIDNIRYGNVPEPAVLALLIVGALFFASPSRR